MTLRVIIADGHDVVLAGLRDWVGGASLDLVGESALGKELLELSTRVDWDVALVGATLPDRTSIAVLEQLRENHPDGALILFSDCENPAIALQTAELGAVLLLKNCTQKALVDALTEGVPRRPAAKRADKTRRTHGDACLTDREKEVLTHLAEGQTNKQIAQALGISYETVKEHVQHILQKVGVADRTQAAVWAVRQGLL